MTSPAGYDHDPQEVYDQGFTDALVEVNGALAAVLRLVESHLPPGPCLRCGRTDGGSES